MANHNHHKTMTSFAMEVAEHVFDCSDYAQSVLDHADHWGFLSEEDATKLQRPRHQLLMDEGPRHATSGRGIDGQKGRSA